jgi:hypothetical protein
MTCLLLLDLFLHAQVRCMHLTEPLFVLIWLHLQLAHSILYIILQVGFVTAVASFSLL